jgi:FeS assembly SUF system protein
MMHPGDRLFLEQRIHEALRSCFDPEIPVNIYDLGLIYDVSVDDLAQVSIRMTLTSRECPVAASLPSEVEAKVRAVEGVSSADVQLVWDPPWHPSRISEPAKHQLGLVD